METNVHYPTDLNLLWDAMRCLIRETGKAARKFEVGGWRQSEQLSRKVHKLFNRVRGRRKRQETDVRALRSVGCREGNFGTARERCLAEKNRGNDAMRGDSQVDRRLLRGETIPQEEKVFIRRAYSLDSKGKGGRSRRAWRSGLRY